MSTDCTDAVTPSEPDLPDSPRGWGEAQPTQLSTERLSNLDVGQIDYALRGLLRSDLHSEILPICLTGEHDRVPPALLDAGLNAQALLWDAAVTTVRRTGGISDRELLQLNLTELQQSYDYEGVDQIELSELIERCYEGDVPDVAAVRQVIADVLELLLADKVEASVWSEWRASGGEPPRDIVESTREIRDAIAVFRSGGEARGPYSTEQFRGRVRQREEVITGVLVANQFALVGAATKSLKTLISLDAAISIATGTNWLGYQHWPCSRPRRVGFFSAESGAETLIHKHDLIADSKRRNLNSTQLEAFDRDLAANILWDEQVPDLSDRASLEWFRKCIADECLNVVFVDPLSMAIGSAGKELANMAVAGQVILKAAHICREANCTLVLVHHTSGDRARMQSDRARSPLELGDIGYPAVTNHARQWITLNRAEAYNETERRSVLWLRAAGSGLQTGGTFRVTVTEGHHHDRWDVAVQSEAQFVENEQSQREHQQRREDRECESRILAHLRAHPGATVSAMSRGGELPGIGARRVSHYLGVLQSRGAVRVETRRNNAKLWFIAREFPGSSAAAVGGDHVDGE